MKLINEWKKSWRMFSIQSLAIATAIQGTWAVLPTEMKSSIPDEWVSVITIAVLVLGFIGRLVVQPKVSEGA